MTRFLTLLGSSSQRKNFQNGLTISFPRDRGLITLEKSEEKSGRRNGTRDATELITDVDLFKASKFQGFFLGRKELESLFTSDSF